MINNINALLARVQSVEIEVNTLKNEKDILTGLILELEERLSKLENEAFDSFIDGSIDTQEESKESEVADD